MRAFVRLRLPDDTCRDLGPGDLIGRHWSCACALDDPRVSEAHAMVSLRGSALKLLALRGRFAVDARPLTELALAAGQRIELARGLALEVAVVELPASVLALEGEGVARQVLDGVVSLRAGPRPAIAPGYRPDADAVVWSDGRQWRVRRRGEGGVGAPLRAGGRIALGAHTVQAVEVPLGQAGQVVTVERGGVDEPLHLIVRYHTAHVHRGAEPPVAIDGLPARILGELAAMGVPAPWEIVARELWPTEADGATLRRRWDVGLARLRRKLRDARLRDDLVRADGSGNFELFLARADTLDLQL